LLVAAYLVEAGLLLVLAPWTNLWERNYFAQALPWLGELMRNRFVRGGVTGVGLLTALAGVVDIGATLVARPKRPAAGPKGESA
jgi:hypothetical protein